MNFQITMPWRVLSMYMPMISLIVICFSSIEPLSHQQQSWFWFDHQHREVLNTHFGCVKTKNELSSACETLTRTTLVTLCQNESRGINVYEAQSVTRVVLIKVSQLIFGFYNIAEVSNIMFYRFSSLSLTWTNPPNF